MSFPLPSSASRRSEVTAASIQSAFRDVTNQYLSANKENIPPAGLSYGTSAGGSKGCGLASSNRSVFADADRTCYGTPVQTELVVDSKRSEDDNDEGDAGLVLRDDAHTVRPAATDSQPLLSPTTTAALAAATPNARRPFDSGAARSVTPSCDARTPGHNAAPPSYTSTLNPTVTTTAAKLVQQRHRSLGGVPNNLAGGSPFYVQGKAAPSFAVEASTSVSGQSSLHCTPSGARRSAGAAAAAAAAAARALSETPTRLDDISFYLNNSFESGSESPMHDGGVQGGNGGATRTPHRSFDLQQAVEEMLRGCLDSSPPAKRSESTGVSPAGSRKRQQEREGTAAAPPFNAFAALDAIFAAPSLSKCAAAAPAMNWEDRTPERVVRQHGVFAESDDEGSGTSPYSDAATRELPATGVRRDPLVYFSTAAAPGGSAVSYDAVSLDGNPYRAVAKLEPPRTADEEEENAFGTLPMPSTAVSQRHTAALEFHNDGSHSGPDMLAMLAAAVQQQQQQQQQTPRSAQGSVEMDSQTFSDRDTEAAAAAHPALPPPSYEDGHQLPSGRYPRRDDPSAAPLSTAAAANGAPHALQPTRRSHHLPQVKAAAGSLIAVSGRRVPVDKLHLLSLSSGEEAAPSSVSPTVAGGARQAGRTPAQSPPTQQQHHVEGPSMRRVPKPNVVTVTRAPAFAGSARSASGVHAQGGGLSSTALPTSSSYTSLSEAGSHRSANVTTTRVVVAGPSARRVPPAATHAVGAAVHSRQNSAAFPVDGSGVRRSCEQDVVAVLQFSKGQTMRFLTNLSADALEAARAALAVDIANAGSGKVEWAAAASLRLARSPLDAVEVGKAYLAHVYGEQSPYDSVAYEDVGVCVRLYTPSSSPPSASGEQAHRDHINGVLLREVDVVGVEVDRKQHEQALQQQTAAYIECERQFKFSSLPFQLESIYFTFDGSVCVVFYRVVGADVPALAASHRFSNTSRVVRELQFHLNCRVFLKQC